MTRIALLGKGPSIDRYRNGKYPVVFAINEAVYAAAPPARIIFVCCDGHVTVTPRKLPPGTEPWLSNDCPSSFPNETRFTPRGVGLPKRLCTLWMTVGLINLLYPSPLNRMVDMFGFDRLDNGSVAYHPRYANERNLTMPFQDQRPSGRARVPRGFFRGFYLGGRTLDEIVFGEDQ